MSRSSAALARAEAVARPGLPFGGFRVSRPAGARLPVVLDAAGRLVHDPGARIQRASAAPDGRTLALEVADDGTERGRLVLVRDGAVRDVPLRLRYAAHRWVDDHLHLTDTDGRHWRVGPDGDAEPAEPPAAPEPARRVTGAVHAVTTADGVLAHTVEAGHSVLLDLDTEHRLRRRIPVSTDTRVRTVTGLAWDAGVAWVRVEGPAEPPVVVPLAEVGDLPEPPRPSRLVRVDGIELVVTGEGPRLVEVYGGFGLVELAGYEPSVPAWCALGGQHVTARVRSAPGAAKAGTVADTVRVARHLGDPVVLAGASHGGLVAASAALAEPGLVAGVACTAAPLDPFRIAEHPLGAAWTEEVGDPADPAVRAAMEDYAPHLRAARWAAGAPYPRFLLTTFDEDARVSPGPTDRLAAVLAARGAAVERVRRPAMGHGGNALDDVHAFAASVLDFALDCTLDRPLDRTGAP